MLVAILFLVGCFFFGSRFFFVAGAIIGFMAII